MDSVASNTKARLVATTVAAFAIVLATTACGQQTPPDTEIGGTQAEVTEPAAGQEGATGELAFGLQRCDPNASVLSADPAFYRDEPIYIGNDQPVDQVRSFAQSRPGYEDIWVDRDHNGWISVGYSSDAAARQAELEAEFPGVGVVAVDVPASDVELRALRTEVEAALQGLSSWTSGHSVARGMVEIFVPVLDEETLSRFSALADPRLCIDGLDPSDAVPDGDQPIEGDGWRLLGNERSGPVYRTGVATTTAQYRNLWIEAGLTGDGPTVDFEHEVVVWFGAVYGSGCPIRMDDVIFDYERNLVHAQFVMPGNPASCNDDANAEAYVVAVLRDHLPQAPFAVQLDAEDPPRGVPEERTMVQVDLRSPGLAASADDLVVTYLGDAPPPEPELLWPGLVIEPGFASTVRIDLDCSVDIIGPLNDAMWRATDPDVINGPPSAWTEAAVDRMVVAELSVTTTPPILTITANGMTVTYDALPNTEEADMSCT